MRRFAFWAIATAGLLAYCNSFSVPFLWDDEYFILDPHIRRYLYLLWKAFLPPPHFQPWVHRPLVTLTLALNYALGGLHPTGYHLFNLAIHLANALLILALLRRILPHPLALTVGLLWVLHPLQTESVTYIYQRAESLMALCTLLTLYGLTRAAESPEQKRWSLLAVAACAAGMTGKQTMIVVPVLALLYDWTSLARFQPKALSRRAGLHGALGATWGILALLLLTGRNDVPSNAGFYFKQITPWQYARTQPLVLLHYLRLAFWPHPLILDYCWPVENNPAVLLLSTLVIGCLLLITLWALRRQLQTGFWGVWFFLILAPVSSIVPCSDLAAEHRMYLPLLSVLVLFVLALGKFYDFCGDPSEALRWYQRVPADEPKS